MVQLLMLVVATVAKMHSAVAHAPRSGRREHYTKFHKPTAAALERALTNHIRLLDGGADGEKMAPFMPEGDLKELASFARRNTAVAGYVLGMVFNELRACACIETTEVEGATSLGFPSSSSLYVTMKVDKVEQLTKKFRSDDHTITKDTSFLGLVTKQETVVGHAWTGYGVAFDLEVKWRFKNTLGDVETLTFSQHVRIEPKPQQTSPIKVATPPATEFDVSAAIDILHDQEVLSRGGLKGGWERLHTEDPQAAERFPRHNRVVEKIEAALGQLSALTDHHVRWLAEYTPIIATNAWSTVEMPWGVSRPDKPKDANVDTTKDLSEIVLSARLSRTLAAFHKDQVADMVSGLGQVADMMQRLCLLKLYAVHTSACYEAIDDIMVRSFFQGIGAHNEVLFQEAKSLDGLLYKIGNFQMDRAGMDLAECNQVYSGCSIGVEMKLPETGDWQRLIAMPCTSTDFSGELLFGGIGCKGVPVVGTYTRYLFSVPTEAGGRHLPMFRIVGSTEFANIPIAVVIGSPDGPKTKSQCVFLFVDGMCFRAALTVAAMPSDAEFAEAMATLPEEFKSFATAIRECDLAESGIDVHVIKLRPLLARATGILEKDLMGTAEFEEQLIRVMRAGCSLESLRQVIPRADGESERVGAARQYDLQHLRAELQRLEERVLARGALDHKKIEPPSPQYVPLGAPYQGVPYGLAATHSSEPPSFAPWAQPLGAGAILQRRNLG